MHCLNFTRILRLLSGFALLLCLPLSFAFAQAKTSTGFYYPLGRNTWSHGDGSWLARDTAHGGNYFDNYYHIGEDMLTINNSLGDSVYAISAGVVTNIGTQGFGSGNVGVVIRHKLNDGSEFLALYGHVHTSKNVGDTVAAGEPFATIGYWSYGNHLHFGIHPSTQIPNSNWGMMPNSAWDSANGFVNPVDWITTKSPLGFSGGNDTNIYVSASGSDSNTGSSDSAYKTVAHAISQASSTQPVTINIAPGTYGERIGTGKHIHFVTWGSGTVRIGG